MDHTIVFEGVGKKFKKGYISDSLRDAIVLPFRKIFFTNGNLNINKKEFWALRNVNFKVRQGEVLGIIGPNGSGKSTTLKLLSRILRPDEGRIIVKGRVGALIELAAGFHPDLTGRENVFLNASILGLKREEIKKKYDEIVEFAELEDFMDTPVKWYSSGMFARLGFSVAVHIDPEILLVDEVLSVGDIGFQQKCERKILSIKERGLTIVFVSHNMGVISNICDRVIVLHKGELLYTGQPQDAINVYLDLLHQGSNEGNEGVKLLKAELNDMEGQKRVAYRPGERCIINLSFKACEEFRRINIGLRIRRRNDGMVIFGTHYTALSGERLNISKDAVLNISFALTLNLTQGIYQIEAVLWDQVKNKPLLIKDINSIVIKDQQKIDGVAHLNPEITTLTIQ